MSKITVFNNGEGNALVKVQAKTKNGDPAGIADVDMLPGEGVEFLLGDDLKVLVSEVRAYVSPQAVPSPVLVNQSDPRIRRVVRDGYGGYVTEPDVSVPGSGPVSFKGA